MRTSIYIPDPLAERAASRYHRAKRADYTLSELVQVALTVLADTPVKDLRPAITTHAASKAKAAPALPGLKGSAGSVS